GRNSSSIGYYVADETALLKRLREHLRERSVTRGDFVLASGKRSTYYIDARPTTMSGEGLTVIGALGLARLQARGWAPRAVGGLRACGTCPRGPPPPPPAPGPCRPPARLDRPSHGAWAAPPGPRDVPAQPPAAVGHRGRFVPDRRRRPVLRGCRGVADHDHG